jgi:hypothetical protein
MLHGRSAEAARIDELLAAARDGRSGALVIRGEAGVGAEGNVSHISTVLRSAYVDHDDRPAAGCPPDAVEPGFHCVRTHWIRCLMAFRLVRRIRTVILMVPV